MGRALTALEQPVDGPETGRSPGVRLRRRASGNRRGTEHAYCCVRRKRLDGTSGSQAPEKLNSLTAAQRPICTCNCRCGSPSRGGLPVMRDEKVCLFLAMPAVGGIPRVHHIPTSPPL